jgi:hypothetical protein
MTFINQWFVTSCMGARAVRGRSRWSDGGSDTWDIEIPAFDIRLTVSNNGYLCSSLFSPKPRCVQLK